jgi:hypothetical protein
MLRMGLCIDPAKEEALGIADKAKRSMGVGVTGLPEKEAGYRERQKKKIIAGFKEYDPHLAAHILPGFGPHEGFDPREQLAVLVQASVLEDVVRKITRGCEYVFAERYIEEPYALEIWFPNPQGIEGAEAVLAGGTEDTLGLGLTIKRRVPHEDPLTVFYGFHIWGTLKVYATILPPGAGADNRGG